MIRVLTEAAESYPRYGFKKLFQVLRRQSNAWHLKRLYRIYFLSKLNFRRKGKQHLPVRNLESLPIPEVLNQSRSSILCTMHWSAADASEPLMGGAFYP